MKQFTDVFFLEPSTVASKGNTQTFVMRNENVD